MDAEIVMRVLTAVRDLRGQYPWAEDVTVLIASAWVTAFTLAKLLSGGKWCGSKGCRAAAKVWRFVFPASKPYEPSELAERILKRVRYAGEVKDKSPQGASGVYVQGYGVVVQAKSDIPLVWVLQAGKSTEAWKLANGSLTDRDKVEIARAANERLQWINNERQARDKEDLLEALS